MFPALATMVPGLVSSMAPNLINGMFKTTQQPSRSSQRRSELLSMASKVLTQKKTVNASPRKPIPRPLPARASSMAPRSIEQPKEDKTLIYVGIGAAALVGIVLLTKK